jgi:two-component system response regulator AtoC
VDVRIIAATNRDLDRAVRQGMFREDLYYRMKVIPIYLPSLKERKDDIPHLVTYFLDQFNREFKKNTHGISREALDCLMRYDWPGNIRELRNVIERAMILETKPQVEIQDLPREITRHPVEDAGTGPREEAEKDLVKQALERTRGNQTRAARLLNISRDALRYKMKKFGFL